MPRIKCPALLEGAGWTKDAYRCSRFNYKILSLDVSDGKPVPYVECSRFACISDVEDTMMSEACGLSRERIRISLDEDTLQIQSGGVTYKYSLSKWAAMARLEENNQQTEEHLRIARREVDRLREELSWVSEKQNSELQLRRSENERLIAENSNLRGMLKVQELANIELVKRVDDAIKFRNGLPDKEKEKN